MRAGRGPGGGGQGAGGLPGGPRSPNAPRPEAAFPGSGAGRLVRICEWCAKAQRRMHALIAGFGIYLIHVSELANVPVILQGIALITIGAAGMVMALGNTDIGAGIKNSVENEGAKTREAIGALGAEMKAEAAKTREADAAEAAKTREADAAEAARTREAIGALGAEMKAESAKTREADAAEAARTREVLISINRTLADMGNIMRSNGAGDGPPGGAGPGVPGRG